MNELLSQKSFVAISHRALIEFDNSLAGIRKFPVRDHDYQSKGEVLRYGDTLVEMSYRLVEQFDVDRTLWVEDQAKIAAAAAKRLGRVVRAQLAADDMLAMGLQQPGGGLFVSELISSPRSGITLNLCVFASDSRDGWLSVLFGRTPQPSLDVNRERSIQVLLERDIEESCCA